MGQETIEDALLIAARYELQGLNVGERAILTSVDRVAEAMTKLEASGQINPFREIGRDLLKANRAFRAGSLDLAALNESLQGARIQMNELRARGIEPDAKALSVLTNAIDRTALALARMNAAGKGPGGTFKDLDEQLSKVAKGGAGFDAGIARTRSGLAQLAVQSLATSSAVGQVTQGIGLLLGLGIGEIIAIAAAVTIVAKAFDALTSKTREAKKEMDEFNKKVDEAIKTRARQESPFVSTLEDIQKVNDEVAKLQARQAQIRKFNEEAFPGTRVENRQDFKDVSTDLAAATARAKELNRQLAESADEAHKLAQAAGDELRHAIEGSQGALEQFTARMAALGQQTFGAQPGFVSQQEIQALEQKRQLTQDILAGDLKSLEASKARVAAQRQEAIAAGAKGDDLKIFNDKLKAFDAQIAARTVIGRQQLDEISRERDLLEATRATNRALEDHNRRVQQAGGGNLLGVNPAGPAPDAGFARQPKVFRKDLGILPDDADIADFQRKLNAITPPPVLPSEQDIQRLLRSAPILRGAVAQGLVPGEGQAKDIQASAAEMQRLAKEQADWNSELDDSIKKSEAAFRTEQIKKMVGAIDAVGAALEGVLGLMGSLDDQTAQVISSMTQLASAIATGDIAGAITAGAGFLSGFFASGPTPEQAARDRTLQENNERLLELKLSLDRANLGAGGIQRATDVAKAVAQAQEASDAALAAKGQPFAIGDTEAAEKAIRDAGFTVKEFGELVKQQTGLTILDERGHILADTLSLVNDAYEKTREQITQFGKDVASQQEFFRNQDRIFGDPSRSADQMKTDALENARTIQLNALELSDSEEAFVKSLDLGTEQGRAAFKKWEQSIADRARKNQLSPDELHDFQNVAELFGFVADTMDILNESAKDAADSLKDLTNLNLPQGFKLSQLAFQASPFGPSRPNDGAQQPLPVTPPSLLTPPAHRGIDITPTVSVASVTIHVNGADKPEETAAAIDKHLRRIGLNQSGDTLQMGLR